MAIFDYIASIKGTQFLYYFTYLGLGMNLLFILIPKIISPKRKIKNQPSLDAYKYLYFAKGYIKMLEHLVLNLYDKKLIELSQNAKKTKVGLKKSVIGLEDHSKSLKNVEQIIINEVPTEQIQYPDFLKQCKNPKIEGLVETEMAQATKEWEDAGYIYPKTYVKTWKRSFNIARWMLFALAFAKMAIGFYKGYGITYLFLLTLLFLVIIPFAIILFTNFKKLTPKGKMYIRKIKKDYSSLKKVSSFTRPKDNLHAALNGTKSLSGDLQNLSEVLVVGTAAFFTATNFINSGAPHTRKSNNSDCSDCSSCSNCSSCSSCSSCGSSCGGCGGCGD